MNIWLTALLIAIICFGSTIPAKAKHDSVLLTLAKNRVELGTSNAIAIGIFDSTGEFKTAAYGISDSQSITADSLFEIGSVTKVFTGTLLADMIAKGLVSLEDPADKFLPQPLPSYEGRDITLSDLATHSSGLPRMPDNCPSYATYRPEDLYNFIKRWKPTRRSGETYEYSNLGFGLLGHILALRLGIPYSDAIESLICKPLGMTSTMTMPQDGSSQRLVQGHNVFGEIIPFWDDGALSGAYALKSNVNDLLRFLKACTTNNPMSSVLNIALSPLREGENPDTRVGLAWNIGKDSEGNSIAWHLGGTAGFRSFIGINQAKETGVVVLSNSENAIDDIGFHLLDPSRPLALPKDVTGLSSSDLGKYVGSYEIFPGAILHITFENDSILFQMPGKPKIKVYQGTDGTFFFPLIPQIVGRPTTDSKGTITGVTWTFQGSTYTAKKVK